MKCRPHGRAIWAFAKLGRANFALEFVRIDRLLVAVHSARIEAESDFRLKIAVVGASVELPILIGLEKNAMVAVAAVRAARGES